MKKNCLKLCLVTAILLQFSFYYSAEAREVSSKVPHVKTIVVDGELGDWSDTAASKLKTPGWMSRQDLSVVSYMGWDAKALYFAMNVTDDVIFNDSDPEKKLYFGDQCRLRLSAQPEKQGVHFGDADIEIYVAPTSLNTVPAASVKLGKQASKVLKSGDDTGIKWAVTEGSRGYVVEMSIPAAILKDSGFKPGDKISYNLAIYDRDTDNKDEWKQTHIRVSSSDVKKQPKQWPVVELAETVDVSSEK